MARARSEVEFGDFQTPEGLAAAVCEVADRAVGAQSIDTGELGRAQADSDSTAGPSAVSAPFAPKAVLEPTCGLGSILLAAIERFPSLEVAVGFDVNEDYVAALSRRLSARHASSKPGLREGRDRPVRAVEASVSTRDFFSVDWASVLRSLPAPLLIIGNPPWVTNAGQGVLGGRNLPPKSNVDLVGLDARTGKSNFDISEWMIDALLAAMDRPGDGLAMLCKTSVARKLLEKVWRRDPSAFGPSIHRIDARRSFGVAVDACLVTFLRHPAGKTSSARGPTCPVYDSLDAVTPTSILGVRDGRLLADLRAYEEVVQFVRSPRSRSAPSLRWRSGIKHDCAKVMELTRLDPSVDQVREGVVGREPGDAPVSVFENGLGERVTLEESCVFPLLKSGDLARGSMSDGLVRGGRAVVVPQRAMGEDTEPLRGSAPATWSYLSKHGSRLDRRSSSIYQGKPRFSIFGVGPYSFAPWKVAVSGLHKEVRFVLVGPMGGKPTMLDDTCYFLPFGTEAEARQYFEVLSSAPVGRFLRAFVFPDSKRPITAGLLAALDLEALVERSGRSWSPAFETSRREASECSGR